MTVYLLLGVVLVLAVLLVAALSRKSQTAAGGSPTNAGSQVTAFVASREELGIFAKMFDAIAKNDRVALQAEVQFINRLVQESGSFAGLTENYVYGQLAKYVQDPARKKKLLDFLAAQGLISLAAPAGAAATI